MAGRENGVQSIIQRQYPKAVYVHCFAHQLNLAILTVSRSVALKDIVPLIKRTSVFFNTPKRQAVLLNQLDTVDTKKTKLVKQALTRWSNFVQCLDTLVELFPAVVNALEHISTSDDFSIDLHFDAVELREDLLCFQNVLTIAVRFVPEFS